MASFIPLSSFQPFFQDLKEWGGFLLMYGQKKASRWGEHFGVVKDLFVDLLIAKRGRYSKHFLNVSFFLLLATAITLGPVIGEYYPTMAQETTPATDSSTLVMSLSDVTTITDPSTKSRFEILDYQVESGDTLGSIAKKFDISVDTIKWANNLKSDNITPGDTIKIPPVTGIVYKVRAGDTIYSLAKQYKSDPQKIVNFPANDFTDLDTFALAIGQTLFIPDGVPPQSVAVYQPANVPKFIPGTGGKFQWPTQGVITQYPVSYHMALDIASNSLPPITAADSGVVSYSGCIKTGYGCHVIINHADGYQTLYGHMSVLSVKIGDSVGRGQVIGRMGSTGRSTGPHCHFEIRRNGVLLNPLPFLK